MNEKINPIAEPKAPTSELHPGAGGVLKHPHPLDGMMEKQQTAAAEQCVKDNDAMTALAMKDRKEPYVMRDDAKFQGM